MVMSEKEKPRQQLREKLRPEGIPMASCQLVIEPENIPAIYASLMTEPQVILYDGKFPEPFPRLVYQISANPADKTQLMFLAVLTLGDEFKEQHGSTVGSEKDLTGLFKRYPESKLSDNRKQLVLCDKNNQLQGVIRWVEGENGEEGLVIQRGGQAGELPLLQEKPVNDLSFQLDAFSLLVQRYIQTIWNTSPGADQKKFRLILNRPDLSEAALRVHFSTFEIVGEKFQELPRRLGLEEIGGYERMKTEIRGLVVDQVWPEQSRGFGTKPFANRFILVTGPEGVGKSLFPKALYWMLREHFGNELEHFRLPLRDIISQNGFRAAEVIKTVLNRLRENENKKIPTLLHLDNLEALVVPRQQTWANADSSQVTSLPSDVEVNAFLNIQNPVISALREFGNEVGGDSHFLIIYGESRLSREQLPEGVQRTFRRAFSLGSPSKEEIVAILRVQMGTTKETAGRVKRNPFSKDFELRLDEIAQQAVGLFGNDIKDALINIANGHKAREGGRKHPRYPRITPEEIIQELGRIKLDKKLGNGPKGPIGFLRSRQ